MMMRGGYSGRPGGGGGFEPRVVQISVERTKLARPAAGKPIEFFVSVHMEGTALTWRDVVEVSPATEQALLEQTAALHLWSLNMGGTVTTAREAVREIGALLENTFLGDKGSALVVSLEPTALLFGADETLLNLPWETMRVAGGAVAPDVPFGRIVSTATIPAARRDPGDEDPTMKILVVANPTNNLPGSDAVITTLEGFRGPQDTGMVEVDVLDPADATSAGLAAAVKGRDYDVVHFAGHGEFDNADPDQSCLVLADGKFTANDVAALEWLTPPYVVFNSACESARGRAGRRLVSKAGNANGLVAAFIAAGAEAYVGHFWPVQNHSAAQFSDVFYRQLFETQNVGIALTRAREQADAAFASDADLTAPGTIFFGDSGTAQRRDVTGAEPPATDPVPRRDLATAH